MTEHHLDLSNRPLGRAASEVAKVLLGKNKIDYAPNKVTEDIVIVENINKLKFNQRKLISKKYYRHSGYLGNLKQVSLKDKIDKDLQGLFRDTVRKMLPNNKLRKLRLKRLRFK